MRRWWFIVFLLLPWLAEAQSTAWEFSLVGGYMTPNNFNMPEYSSNAFGAEVAWWYRVESDEWWVQRRHNPSFGIRASYSHTSESLSGHRLGLEGLVSCPLWNRVDYHLGVGLSGYTRSAYFTHDPENIFITTLVCCLIDVGFDFRITKHLSFSLAFLHSSNGMLNRPNKGLNYLQWSASWRTGSALNKMLRSADGEPMSAFEPLAIRPPAFEPRELGFTLQGGAVVSRDLQQEGYYPCYDLSLNYQYYLDPVVAVGGTLDLWYNFSHRGLAQLYGESYTFPCYVGVMPYLEGFWGPVSFRGGIGTTVISPKRVNVKLYERLGVYYNFGSNYVGIAVNAHAGMVEFIELAYGHRFTLK